MGDIVTNGGIREHLHSYEQSIASKNIEFQLQKSDYLLRTLGPKRLPERTARAMAELDLVATTPISPSDVHILFSNDPEFSNVYCVVKRNLIAPLLLDINQAGGVVRVISFEYNGTKLFADRLSLETVMPPTKRQIAARRAPWFVAGLFALVAIGTYIHAQTKLSMASDNLAATISGLEAQARQARNFLAARQAEIDHVSSLRHDRTDLPSNIRLWPAGAGTAALDRARWQRSLCECLAAGTSQAGTDDPVHGEPAGNILQLFCHILAEAAKGSATAGTVLVAGGQFYLLARDVIGDRTALRLVLLFLVRQAQLCSHLGDRDLGCLERQLKLLDGLRRRAKAMASVTGELVAQLLYQHRLRLHFGQRHEPPQFLGVVRQGFGHVQHG
nr:hypothetical protein [Oryzicola mucosus]